MKICVIHDLPDWQVTSYGNGLSYVLVSKSAKKDIYFQDDDAREFMARFADLTEGTLSLDYADAFAVLWSDYADCARPMLGDIESAARYA